MSKLFRTCAGGEANVLKIAREYAGTPKYELFIEANGWNEEQAEYIRKHAPNTSSIHNS